MASKNETGGGEGIEVLKNEPFSATEGVQPKYGGLKPELHCVRATHVRRTCNVRATYV
jgi:hypothetical protein